MTKKYFVLFFIFTSCFINGQFSVPQPGGIFPVFVIDDNNDGFAEFNIHLFLQTYYRNDMLKSDYDLSGYELQLYPTYENKINSTNVIGKTYTNTVKDRQECAIKFIYSGNGIKYDEFFLDSYYSAFILVTLAFDGDIDKDGVLNAAETGLYEDSNTGLNLYIDTDGDGLYNFEDKDDDGDGILTINEDTNKNGNYEDDDSNGNGIPNYLDSKNTLTVNQENKNLFTISPNPASNFINLNLDNTVATYKVSIYDTSGKLVLQAVNSNIISISSLKSGIYILNIKTDINSMTKKLIVL